MCDFTPEREPPFATPIVDAVETSSTQTNRAGSLHVTVADFALTGDAEEVALVRAIGDMLLDAWITENLSKSRRTALTPIRLRANTPTPQREKGDAA